MHPEAIEVVVSQSGEIYVNRYIGQGLPLCSAQSLQVNQNGFRLLGAVVDFGTGMLRPLPAMGWSLGQSLTLPGRKTSIFSKNAALMYHFRLFIQVVGVLPPNERAGLDCRT